MAGVFTSAVAGLAVTLAALAPVAPSPAWAQDALPNTVKEEPKAEAAAEPAKTQDPAPPAWPVSGIFTVSDTKDVGKLLKLAPLEGLKIRGWVDAYYMYNNNTPHRSAVDAAQGDSIIKGRNVSIEGRVFDIHHNSFSLSLAEIELELVPSAGEVGFKLDLAWGEENDIYNDSIRAALDVTGSGDSISDFDKTFHHASVSYVAPIGNGLRFDLGKFVTHIGGETFESVKNWNYSHAYFYTYAIPFQDTGLKMSYPLTADGKIYAEFYAVNGWNVTVDNNTQKTIGPTLGIVNPDWAPWLQVYANFLIGDEVAVNTKSGTRTLFDAQVILGPFLDGKLMLMANVDVGSQEDAFTGAAGTPEDADWTGFAFYARYKLTKDLLTKGDELEPSVRFELYNDSDGWTTNTKIDPATGNYSPAAPLEENRFTSFTLNLNYRIGINKWSTLLIRPEIRIDTADENFFTDNRLYRDEDTQVTYGVGVAWIF